MEVLDAFTLLPSCFPIPAWMYVHFSLLRWMCLPQTRAVEVLSLYFLSFLLFFWWTQYNKMFRSNSTKANRNLCWRTLPSQRMWNFPTCPGSSTTTYLTCSSYISSSFAFPLLHFCHQNFGHLKGKIAATLGAARGGWGSCLCTRMFTENLWQPDQI